MTSNQIALRDSETKREDVREKKRSNRAKERLDKEKIQTERRGQEMKATTDILGLASKLNDPEWYSAEPQLVKDVASISFNTPLGLKFTHMGGQGSTIVPGVMVLKFMPTLGKLATNGQASTADVAAKSLYAYVRYANSGSRNYESSDLMMYLLAVTEAYSYYAYMTRVYSLLTTAKSENRYYIDAMLTGVGVNPSDFRQQISNFRAYINSFAIRLNSLYIPKDLPYMKRHVWMNSTIFKDSNIKKSQEYMFLQYNFLKYDDKVGKLTIFPSDIPESDYASYAYNFRPGANFTFDQIRKTGDLIINQLITSEDAGLMGGDILKAYGESAMAYASVIPDTYHIESVYSSEVLSQISNAVLIGIPTTGFTDGDRFHMFDISQISSNLVDYLTQGLPYYATSKDATDKTNVVGYGFPCTLGLTQQEYVATPISTQRGVLLNFGWDNVSPDDVMVASRFIYTISSSHYFTFGAAAGSIQCGAAIDMGSEVLLDYNILTLQANGATNVSSNISSCIKSDTQYAVDTLASVSNFDWHPRLYVYDLGFESSQTGFSDLANYTTIGDQVIGNLNYTAVLSEFGIPKLGLTVRNRNK